LVYKILTIYIRECATHLESQLGSRASLCFKYLARAIYMWDQVAVWSPLVRKRRAKCWIVKICNCDQVADISSMTSQYVKKCWHRIMNCVF